MIYLGANLNNFECETNFNSYLDFINLKIMDLLLAWFIKSVALIPNWGFSSKYQLISSVWSPHSLFAWSSWFSLTF